MLSVTRLRVRILFFYLWNALSGLIIMAAPLSGELVRFRWKTVKNADRYLLTVYQDAEVRSAWVRNNSVFLDEKSRFTLLAIDRNGNIIARPAVRKFPLKRKNSQPADTLKTKPQILVKKMIRTKKRKKRAKQIKQLEQERNQAFTSEKNGHIIAIPSAGHESLSAQGGISEFNGSTLIAAIDLEFSLYPVFYSRSSGDQVTFTFHQHNFATYHEEASDSAEGAQTSLIEIQQYEVGADYSFSGFHSRAGLFHPFAGLHLLQKSAMKILSEETGATSPRPQILLSPGVGLHWQSASSRPDYTAQLRVLPWAPGTLQFYQIQAALQRRFYLPQRLFLLAGLSWQKDSLELKLVCPAVESASACQDHSLNKMTRSSFQLGLGLSF